MVIGAMMNMLANKVCSGGDLYLEEGVVLCTKGSVARDYRGYVAHVVKYILTLKME